MDCNGLSEQKDLWMCKWIEDNARQYDVVIVADYGHGAISKNLINVLARNSRFLAINTQANAGNRGFNTISKYPNMDYACLAEHEIRVETRVMNGDIRTLMEPLAKKLACKYFVVTSITFTN